jgi:Domain of unknown function (DUF5655)
MQRVTRAQAKMWRCSNCGRRFANRNQSHSCARQTLREHLRGRTPHALALFRAFVQMVRRCGPVLILPEKTRVAFQVRMSFAAIRFRRDGLDGHVVLARRVESPRFTRIDTISPRNHVHNFRLNSREDLDATLFAHLREAYRVGRQLHLKP